MKTGSSIAIAAGLASVAGVASAQYGYMMDGGMWGGHWMGGFGGVAGAVLLAAVVGLVVWIVMRRRP